MDQCKFHNIFLNIFNCYLLNLCNYFSFRHYVCKDKSSKTKCPGRGVFYNNEFHETIKHEHKIDDKDNLKRLFKDEMFEVCMMFPNRSERVLYNEIIEE